MQIKRVVPNAPENFLTEPRYSQQSCHVTKSKPIPPTTPSQTAKPQHLIQSLTGLCKYFNSKDETKQITYFAPKSIQRSSASLSPRQQIGNISDSSPLLVKQLLYGNKQQGKENQNPTSKINFGQHISEFKSVPNLFQQEKQLVKVNDSSHKKSMGTLSKNQKSRNASVQYQEDWKQKYENLQESLCSRIQQLENELEEMEKNRKIDQMHSDEQTNEYISQLQMIIQEKDQQIVDIEAINQDLQQKLEKQQKEIKILKDQRQSYLNIYNDHNQLDKQELKRLHQVEQQFQKLKSFLPQVSYTMKSIQQMVEMADAPQLNLSLSSVSMVEMINEIRETCTPKEEQKSKKSINLSEN